MNEFIERAARLSPRRLLLLAGELQARLEALSAQNKHDVHAPVAVIGMAGRFPGAADLKAYWDLLANGRDAVREIPADRWDVDAYYDPDPAADGKIATRWGGFIDDVFDFDPALFGITPREAIGMDPQQRLVLHTAWEALEAAGVAPDSLQGSLTGVFVGACNSDYMYRMTAAGDEYHDMYMSSGNAHSVISGRVSYVLGLQGPSLTVDTACSSSLTAIYLAAESLRSRACRMALAGGVNAILATETSIALSRARMMAVDGRCKAFDAAADGFVRSEGCGLVVLKLLEDALADGDAILGVIRGAAINQDGRSNGLTAPNGPSQTAVVRAALADAGLAPALVSYVETHGTGTSLGDPIEAQALGEALGAEHSSGQPVLIGSVKSNIGHLESAAGVASFIKLILMLQHHQIPANLHFKTPNPHIPWERLPLRVPTAFTAWQPVQGRWIGGVSSFGFSGTNVHLLVEAPPERATERAGETPGQPGEAAGVQVLGISAHNSKALTELAQRYIHSLANLPAADFAALCRSAHWGRAGLAQRLAFVADGPEQARRKLESFVSGVSPAEIHHGAIPAGSRPETAFLFTGHGAQAVGMGADLYRSNPVYRRMFGQAAALFDAALPRPLVDIVYGNDVEAGSRLLNKRMLAAQAAMFCLQVSLAEVWRSCGLAPAAVLGHSLGEYAAAWLAGVFSLEDAARLVVARARLLDSIPAEGAMAAVFASAEEISNHLTAYRDVEIAAMNGPQETVITGPEAQIGPALEVLRAKRIRSRRLAVTQAAHSAAVEPLLADFEKVASSIGYSEPELMLVSATLGRAVNPREVTSPGYWCAHLRRPVRFVDGVQALAELKPAAFVEIGPAPVLLALGRRCLPESPAAWFPSLRPGQADTVQMLESMAGLWAAGCSLHWTAFLPVQEERRVALPTYPFQSERFCVPAADSRQGSPGERRIGPGRDWHGKPHTLRAARLTSPALDGEVFEAFAGVSTPPFLAHHRVHGLALLPSPAFLEITAQAAQQVIQRDFVIEDFSITTGLVLPEDDLCRIQIVIDREQGGCQRFSLYSQEAARSASPDGWTLHATGQLRPVNEPPAPAGVIDIQAIQARCEAQIEAEAYYGHLQHLGLEFGPSFRGLRRIWQNAQEALGEVVMPEGLQAEMSDYAFHPAFLDACFHLLGAPLYDQGLDEAYLLIGIDRLRMYRTPSTRLWNHTVLRRSQGERSRQALTADVRLYNDAGELVAEAEGLHLLLAQREALLRSVHALPADWFYELTWQECPAAKTVTAGTSNYGREENESWLVFADRGGVGAALAERLINAGRAVTLVERGEPFHLEAGRITLNPDRPEDYQRLAEFCAKGSAQPVYLWGLDMDSDPAAGAGYGNSLPAETLQWCQDALGVLQLALKGTWIVTRGAQVISAEAAPLHPGQAALWGLGRVAALEQPGWGGMIDLDPVWNAAACAEAILAELLNSDGEDAVAFHAGRRLAARLSRTPAPRRQLPGLRKDGAYLITGGLGGLGLQLAQWMAENGAGTLVLAGRTPLPDRSTWDSGLQTDSETTRRIAAIRAVEALGARVVTSVVDVSDAGAVSALIQRFGQDLPALRGVIHAAAHLSSSPLRQLDRGELERTLESKAVGAWNLHCSTQALDLDFFVLFSSTTALWGVEGMAAYAAANSFLDGLAHLRRQQGLPAISVNWGTWDVMRLASQENQARYARFGLIPMEAHTALACLGSLLGKNTPAQVSIAAIDWKRLIPAYEARRRRPLFSALEEPSSAILQTGGGNEAPPWMREVDGLEDEARSARLLDLVKQAVASVARCASADAVDPQQGLFEMGLDSLMSVELKGLLEKGMGRSLPATLTFNYPTPGDLAGYLDELAFPKPVQESVAAEQPGAEVEVVPPGGLDDLSEDDLEEMLQRRLKRLS